MLLLYASVMQSIIGLSRIQCACFIRQQTILPITKQGGEATLGWGGGGGGGGGE